MGNFFSRSAPITTRARQRQRSQRDEEREEDGNDLEKNEGKMKSTRSRDNNSGRRTNTVTSRRNARAPIGGHLVHLGDFGGKPTLPGMVARGRL